MDKIEALRKTEESIEQNKKQSLVYGIALLFLGAMLYLFVAYFSNYFIDFDLDGHLFRAVLIAATITLPPFALVLYGGILIIFRKDFFSMPGIAQTLGMKPISTDRDNHLQALAACSSASFRYYQSEKQKQQGSIRRRYYRDVCEWMFMFWLLYDDADTQLQPYKDTKLTELKNRLQLRNPLTQRMMSKAVPICVLLPLLVLLFFGSEDGYHNFKFYFISSAGLALSSIALHLYVSGIISTKKKSN
jgi:hypothetical protein